MPFSLPSRLLRRRILAGLLPVCIVGVVVSAAEKVEKDPALVMREQMVVVSRQLGVTCTHCHRTDNFRDGKMKTFQVAKDHMRIVDLLNSQGFKGKPKADCFMCHRGKAVPDYVETPLPEKRH